MDWQPIETAPHGQHILLGRHCSSSGEWLCTIGIREPAGSSEPNDDDPYGDAWGPYQWLWDVDSGMVEHVEGEWGTHWMPLPAAPSTEG